MSTQTASPIVVNKSNPIVGDAGIRYHKPFNDAVITLEVQPGDATGPLPAEDAKALVEALCADVDDAWTAERNADIAMRLALSLSASTTDDEMAVERAEGKTRSAKMQQAAEVQQATAVGVASASSQIIQFLLTDGDTDHDYVALGEQFENDRREGDNDLEATDGWTGPGELSAMKRMQAVDYFRGQASAEFRNGDEAGEEASASAYSFGRSQAFQDAADKLSTEE